MTQEQLQSVFNARADRASQQARLTVMLGEVRTSGSQLALAAAVLMGGAVVGFLAMVLL